MNRRAALGLGTGVAVIVLLVMTAEKRDDRAASPLAVLNRTQQGLHWDELVARKWPEIDTPAEDAKATGRDMQEGFGGSHVLAGLSAELAALERSALRPRLIRESRLRKRQGLTGRARARVLGKRSWWLATWCDELWQANQAALLSSAYALLGHYGYAFPPDRPRGERTFRALIHCRRAIRFSITAGDLAPRKERERRDWFVPVRKEVAELLEHIRAIEPENRQQRQWHRALLDAAEADRAWLGFIEDAQRDPPTDVEKRRAIRRWVPADSAFTRATANAPRPDR